MQQGKGQWQCYCLAYFGLAYSCLASDTRWSTLRNKVETGKHDQHGASNTEPEASHQNLPDNQSLTSCQADHNAKAIDDVEDYRTNREEQW